MSRVLTIARLRWALTMATVRKSSWQAVGAVISLIMVVGVVCLAWRVTLPAGEYVNATDTPIDLGRMQSLLVIAASLLSVGVVVIQLMVIGEGSTLSPSRFALYGIPDLQLEAGLLLAGLVGLPALCGLGGFLSLAALYRNLGGGAVAMSLVSAFLAVAVMLSLSKMTLSLATTLVSSRRGQTILYLIVFLCFIGLIYAPQTIAMGTMHKAGTDWGTIGRAASVLSWTPLAAAFQLPVDLYGGAWPSLIGRLCLLAATLVVCFLVGMWCLDRSRHQEAHARTAHVTGRGLGAFDRCPDTVSGAISARILTYLRRDSRLILYYIMPVVFLAVFALIGGQEASMVWAAPFMGFLMLTMLEDNALSYDGPGLRMQILAGVPGLEDRKGRIRVLLSIDLAYALIVCAVCTLVSGYWKNASGLLGSLGMTCGLAGIIMAGLGMAEIFSCLLMYPVPSMDRPFSSPQGRAVSQGFFPILEVLVDLLVMVPSFLALAGLSAGRGEYAWVAGPVALLNGLVVLLIGVWAGGRIMGGRQLQILRTVDGYASLQR